MTLFDSHRLLLFLPAAAILAATPGPGILYVLTRTIAGGRRDGLLSSLGTLLGGMAHVFAAALGISALLAASAVAFAGVKYAGAAYLVYLGIRMIRSRDEAAGEGDGQPGPTFSVHAGGGNGSLKSQDRAVLFVIYSALHRAGVRKYV